MRLLRYFLHKLAHAGFGALVWYQILFWSHRSKPGWNDNINYLRENTYCKQFKSKSI